MAQHALTTTFTPPSNCLNTAWYNYGAAVVIGPQSGYLSCYPSDWVQTTTGFYYSPGICPSGYVSACSSENTAGTVTETVVNCCPSNFQCVPSTGSVEYPWWSTYSCTRDFETSPSLITVTVFSSATPVQISTLSTYGLNAYSIQIRFQSTDFQPTASSSGATLPIASLPASTAKSASAGGKNDGSSSLSTGAQAGIGVGVGVGGLLLILGLIFFFYRRRRSSGKSRNQPVEPPHRGDGALYSKPELAADGSSQNRRHELETPAAELYGSHGSYKQDRVPHELSSGTIKSR